MNPQDVCEQMKSLLDGLEVEVFDWVPSSPPLPALLIYPDTQWTYTTTEPVPFVVWAIGGDVETQGAQERFNRWCADDGDQSVRAAILTDQTLGRTVSTVLPVEVRNRGKVTMTDGRTVVQAELVFHVWR
jgi:hypothetical protein